MQPTPEDLLGLPVLSPTGARIGTVVDVGLFNWRQPKFLLVRGAPDAPLLRVDLGQVEDLGADAIRLVAPVHPAHLPA